jgi:hypothetical protein
VRAVLAGVGVFLVLGSCAVALDLHASTARVYHACEVGLQTIYRIGYVSRDTSSPGAVFGSEQGDASTQDSHLVLTGVLTATDAACDAGGATAILNVVQPNVRIDGSATPGLFAAILTNDLNHPYVVRTDASGRVVAFAHDPASGELGTSLMHRIVAQMEIVASERPTLDARSWSVDEPDIAGSRRSSYTMQPWVNDPFGGGTLSFHRTSGVFVDPPNDGRVIRHATVHGVGDDTGRYGLDGKLASLQASYVEESLIGSNIVARSQIVVDVSRLGSPSLSPDRLEPIAAYATKLLATRNVAPLHIEQSEDAADRTGFASLLGKDTATTLGRALAAAPKKTDARTRSALADKFAGLFYAHPATLATFYPRMLAAGDESTTFGVLVPALEHADTPQAQRTLIRLFQARAHDKAGPGLAAGLGLLERPIPEVDAQLRRCADGSSDQTARAAELGLGTIAWTVSPADPVRSRTLAQQIAARLRAARKPDLAQLELLALGNTRDAAQLGAIEPFATASDEGVRAATAVALRHQPSSSADETLVTLLHDRSAVVRLSAASAFQSRNPGPTAYLALEAAARNDTNETVRSDAILAVWKAREEHPDAVAFVRDVANGDPDSGVRKSAQAALDADTGGDPELESPIESVLGVR